MFCPKCGTQLRDGARFCKSCGAAIPAPEPVPAAEPIPAPVPEPMPEPEKKVWDSLNEILEEKIDIASVIEETQEVPAEEPVIPAEGGTLFAQIHSLITKLEKEFDAKIAEQNQNSERSDLILEEQKKVQEEIEGLYQEKGMLQNEVERLRRDNESLQTKMETLQSTVDMLKSLLNDKNAEMEELYGKYVQEQENVSRLRQELAAAPVQPEPIPVQQEPVLVQPEPIPEQKLEKRCPGCGAVVEDNTFFCGECGTRLS